MASGTIRATVTGVADLRADLEAVRLGLGRELTRTLKDAAGLATQATKPLTPFDPLHRVTRPDGLPHIRDSVFAIALGSGAAVASRHPGAVVHEYGGTIAPRGKPIQIARSEMAHTAGEAQLPAINDLLERRINALIAQHFS